jgi:hypothetical protein
MDNFYAKRTLLAVLAVVAGATAGLLLNAALESTLSASAHDEVTIADRIDLATCARIMRIGNLHQSQLDACANKIDLFLPEYADRDESY